MFRRGFVFAYGLTSYCLAMAVITYLIGFSENLLVPRSLDRATESGPLVSVLINAGLIGLFGLQHAIMARPRFKRWLTRFIPQAAERSTFVLVAAGLLALTCWQWRSMPTVLWAFETGWARGTMYALSGLGWALVLYSTFIIDHFGLFGLAQVWRHLRGTAEPQSTFAVRSAYRFVRHPIMLGFLIAFWFAPEMTIGRLMFAGVFTAYVLIGIRMEERDLISALGASYVEYRRRTPALLPFRRPVAVAQPEPANEEDDPASLSTIRDDFDLLELIRERLKHGSDSETLDLNDSGLSV